MGSISPGGFCTFYDENCPSTMAVVYTGDVGAGKRERYANLVTTSPKGHCVDSFSGTSCAAPLAAGIFALVLEANPDLTWRDMQHLVVHTARKNDPDGLSWKTVRPPKKTPKNEIEFTCNAFFSAQFINKVRDRKQSANYK